MNATEKEMRDAGLYFETFRFSVKPITELAEIFARIRADSAEQARKEAAELAVKWIEDQGTVFTGQDHYPCFDPHHFDDELRRAVLSDTPANEPKQTDAEKLTIAVKALGNISNYAGKDEVGCIMRAWARNALKEIQG